MENFGKPKVYRYSLVSSLDDQSAGTPLLAPNVVSSSIWKRLTRKQAIKGLIGGANMGHSAPDETPKETRLKKTLGVVDLVAYGLGSTVGAGIFITAGQLIVKHESYIHIP